MLAIDRSGDYPDFRTVVGDARQITGTVMPEPRVGLLGRLRQGNPGLDAEQFRVPGALLIAGAFGMDDALAGGHPVSTSPGRYRLLEPQAVAMHDLASEKIGHRGETDMGMRAHIYALAEDELGRSHLIEEDEGSEPSACAATEGPCAPRTHRGRAPEAR